MGGTGDVMCGGLVRLWWGTGEVRRWTGDVMGLVDW